VIHLHIKAKQGHSYWRKKQRYFTCVLLPLSKRNYYLSCSSFQYYP